MSDAVAATFGVEEEYHVVDAATLQLREAPELPPEGRLQPEIATTQLEMSTAVCTTLDELRREIVAARREAAEATAASGAAILAASTHPHASWDEQRLTLRPRYLELLERWGVLALQQVICGCHVHVGVPDLDTAVVVMDHVRPYLPLLLALTGSSPFHESVDTGYDSYRTQWFSRWPINGPAGVLGSGDAFREVVHDLTVAGAIDDASHLYWDVRPSTRYPTVEFRVADVCTEVDDVVLHAALVRALVGTVAARADRGEQPPQLRGELLRAARWRAARYGLSEPLLDPVARDLVPVGTALERLLRELEPALGPDVAEVRALAEQLLARGTSATRQRAVLHRTGDWRAVTADVMRRSVPG